VRLSPAFGEWMMAWPQGWVTDPAIGLSRNEQLRAVGNGVVIPCAVAAYRYLLGVAAASMREAS
jgi:DNA (cytosine-5)-methyltransferase 1